MLEQTYLSKTGTEATHLNRYRQLPFSGAKNFRDIGGYKTVDGKTTRWGMVYRSDGLNGLTAADQKLFLSLALDRIIDFRTDWERASRPDRLPIGMNVRVVELPILDSSTQVWRDERAEMVKNLRQLDPSHYMTTTYVELATRFTPEMKKYMQKLLSADGKPILLHCTAGKDRTGFATAIFLRMLGVPQATVVEDYLLTNAYLIPGYKRSLFFVRLLRGKQFVEKIKEFMLAHPSYLAAAFAAIDREHGSFENYVRDGLGLTEKDLERLKVLYLE